MVKGRGSVMEHQIMKASDPHVCSATDNVPTPCWLCDGGLACCKVCGKAEIELDECPECPGARVSEDEMADACRFCGKGLVFEESLKRDACDDCADREGLE